MWIGSWAKERNDDPEVGRTAEIPKRVAAANGIRAHSSACIRARKWHSATDRI